MAGSTSFREPKQARSRRTTDRVLDALEEMLREGPFERITMRELLKRSRTSAGSFYARFPTREALLPALYDRHDEQLHERTSGTEEQSEPATLEELVFAMTRRIVEGMRERRWFVSAVALHARMHPELIPEDQRKRREAVHATWHERILAFRDQIGHPDPESAVAFGLFMVVSTCREKVVFGDAPLATSFELSDARLAEESARAFLNYLSVKPAGRKT